MRLTCRQGPVSMFQILPAHLSSLTGSLQDPEPELLLMQGRFWKALSGRLQAALQGLFATTLQGRLAAALPECPRLTPL